MQPKITVIHPNITNEERAERIKHLEHVISNILGYNVGIIYASEKSLIKEGDNVEIIYAPKEPLNNKGDNAI